MPRSLNANLVFGASALGAGYATEAVGDMINLPENSMQRMLLNVGVAGASLVGSTMLSQGMITNVTDGVGAGLLGVAGAQAQRGALNLTGSYGKVSSYRPRNISVRSSTSGNNGNSRPKVTI